MTAHPALAALALLALLVALVALAVGTYAAVAVRRIRAVRDRRPEGQLRADDERRMNLGAPRATGERRRTDLGPSARHRAPDEFGRARRRDADDPRWQTQQIPPVVDEPATVEHAPPTAEARALPPPGRIRDR